MWTTGTLKNAFVAENRLKGKPSSGYNWEETKDAYVEQQIPWQLINLGPMIKIPVFAGRAGPN